MGRFPKPEERGVNEPGLVGLELFTASIAEESHCVLVYRRKEGTSNTKNGLRQSSKNGNGRNEYFLSLLFLSRLSLRPEKPRALPEKRYSIDVYYHDSTFMSKKLVFSSLIFG